MKYTAIYAVRTEIIHGSVDIPFMYFHLNLYTIYDAYDFHTMYTYIGWYQFCLLRIIVQKQYAATCKANNCSRPDIIGRPFFSRICLLPDYLRILKAYKINEIKPNEC